MMARDWAIVVSPTIRAGHQALRIDCTVFEFVFFICGSAQVDVYASYWTPLRLRAMRVRKAAELRK